MLSINKTEAEMQAAKQLDRQLAHWAATHEQHVAVRGRRAAEIKAGLRRSVVDNFDHVGYLRSVYEWESKRRGAKR